MDSGTCYPPGEGHPRLDAARGVRQERGGEKVTPPMQTAAAHPYDLAFASLPEPTLLVDADGHLTRMNGAAEALLGRAAALAARRGRSLARALPWLAPAAERVLAGATEAGLEAEVESAGGRRHIAA